MQSAVSIVSSKRSAHDEPATRYKRRRRNALPLFRPCNIQAAYALSGSDQERPALGGDPRQGGWRRIGPTLAVTGQSVA